MSGARGPGRREALLGAGGVLLALCCIALPAILGVAVGSVLGGVLDGIAIGLIVLAVAFFIHRRNCATCRCCGGAESP